MFALGIGPEISEAVKEIYKAARVGHCSLFLFSLTIDTQVPIEWEEVSVTPILKGGRTVIPDATITSVKRNTVALKGGTLVSRCSRRLTLMHRSTGDSK